jgi:hypothetical protein
MMHCKNVNPNFCITTKKVPGDEKLTFVNIRAENIYIRTIFNQLSEKKKYKYVLKSFKRWEEFLQSHPTIIEIEIPTLHSLLAKKRNTHIIILHVLVYQNDHQLATGLLLFNNENGNKQIHNKIGLIYRNQLKMNSLNVYQK